MVAPGLEVGAKAKVEHIVFESSSHHVKAGMCGEGQPIETGVLTRFARGHWCIVRMRSLMRVLDISGDRARGL